MSLPAKVSSCNRESEHLGIATHSSMLPNHAKMQFAGYLFGRRLLELPDIYLPRSTFINCGNDKYINVTRC